MKYIVKDLPRTPIYICLLISACYFILYSLVNHWPMDRAEFPLLNSEESIPYMSWTYLIYLSGFLQALIVIRLIPRKFLLPYMLGPSLALISGLAFFILYPIEYPRHMFPDDNIIINMFRMLDKPGSCFPSLHVAMTILFAYIYTLISTFHIRHYKVKVDAKENKRIVLMNTFMWLWTISIIVSVLTTKQHYIMDIFGGMALSLFVILVMDRYVYVTVDK